MSEEVITPKEWLSEQLANAWELEQLRRADKVSGSVSVPIRQLWHIYGALGTALLELQESAPDVAAETIEIIGRAQLAKDTYDWRISGHHDEESAR